MRCTKVWLSSRFRRASPSVLRRTSKRRCCSSRKTRSDLLKTDYKLSFLSRVDPLLPGVRRRARPAGPNRQGTRGGRLEPCARARRADRRCGTRSRERRDVPARSRAVGRGCAVLLAVAGAIIPLGDHRRRHPPPPASAVERHRITRARAPGRDHDIAIESASIEEHGWETACSSCSSKPAAAWLPRGGAVIIVPDGALNGLNFETLPVDGATRHYWIEDVELQVAPSSRSRPGLTYRLTHLYLILYIYIYI